MSCLARNIIPLRKCAFANLSDRLYRVCIENPGNYCLTRRSRKGAILKCGYAALVLDCCYVDICVIFSSSGSLRMRLISQFSRASGARFSETDDSPETVVGRWILPAKLKALLGSSTLLSQVVPGKYLMAESKSPLYGITPIGIYTTPGFL